MLNNEGEQFELALASVTPAAAAGTTVTFNSGGAIAINEVKLPQITLSASPASVAEGNPVRLTAMLTDPLITSVPEETDFGTGARRFQHGRYERLRDPGQHRDTDGWQYGNG